MSQLDRCFKKVGWVERVSEVSNSGGQIGTKTSVVVVTRTTPEQ